VMSAVCAAVAGLTLYVALVRGVGGRPVAELAGALCLAWSPLVWSQATISEVYTLALCFFGAIWLLLACGGQRARRLAAYLLGLGLGSHPTLLLLLPAGLWLLRGRTGFTRREWLPLAMALLLGTGVFLFLPWRAAQWPPIDWGAPTNAERL